MKRKQIVLDQTVYCDMDGVLADFNAEPDGINRFATEKGFFYKLKPLKKNVRALRNAIIDGNRVFILSASPNEMADGDKRKWLKKYIPELADGNIILMRNGQNKADFRKGDGLLLDDYGKNIQQWMLASSHQLAWKITADGQIKHIISMVKEMI